MAYEKGARVRITVWAAISGGALLVSAGGYAVADAADVVPGWVTSQPAHVPPAPRPVAASVSAIALPALPKLAVDSTAPIPSGAKVQALAEALLADSRTGWSTGISVVDIATGEVLADVRADDAQVPASNVKLLTAAGVYLGVGPDLQLRTSVMWAGSPADSGATRLTLLSRGDMLLAAASGHNGTSPGANGYAGLGDLADLTVVALADAGVTTVTLSLDDSAFAGPAQPIHWPSSAISNGYAAPVTGLAVNVGRTSNEPYPPRWDDPSLHALGVFVERLAEQGITVTSTSRAAAPAGSVELAAVDGAPMIEVLAHMLRYSDNTIAELVVMVLAIHEGKAGTIANGTAEVLRQARGAGLALGGVILDDGSGFSRYSRIPPAALTEAIAFFARDAQLDDLLEVLAISGMQGTIHDRLDGATAGQVRAKTGSLGGVTSLSGTVVTADGRWLAFSVLADNMPYGQDKPRAAIDTFVGALAACGCG